MIDFISTHPDAHPQTIACANLLAAVIAQAIDDASNQHVAAGDQAAAIHWLFEKSSTFKDYAALIGADAQAIREALLAPHNNLASDPIKNKFPAAKRRLLQINYRQWLARHDAEQKVLKNMEKK
jgi:hypothetical protein